MDINTIILTNISPELHKHIITELKYEVEKPKIMFTIEKCSDVTSIKMKNKMIKKTI